MKDRESTRYSQRALCCVLLLSLAHTSAACAYSETALLNFRQHSISDFHWNLTWNNPPCADDYPTSYMIKPNIMNNDDVGHDCHFTIVTPNTIVAGDANSIIVGKTTNWQTTCGWAPGGPWVVPSYDVKGSSTFDFRIGANSWANGGNNFNYVSDTMAISCWEL